MTDKKVDFYLALANTLALALFGIIATIYVEIRTYLDNEARKAAGQLVGDYGMNGELWWTLSAAVVLIGVMMTMMYLKVFELTN